MQLKQCLNYDTLLPALIHPSVSFLSREEFQLINQPQLTNGQKVNRLLDILFRPSTPLPIYRKFLVCLQMAKEHEGHNYLWWRIWRHPKLPANEVELIKDLCTQVHYDCSDLPKLPPLLELQGDLVTEKFKKIEEILWDHFRKGEYFKLKEITSRLIVGPSQEWKIVGLWFNAYNCVFIHECKEHKYCIPNILEPALELCKDPVVLNRNILEARICLRIAKVYLYTGYPSKALPYTERAHDLLCLTRGYDSANLALHEAQAMSATAPERCDEIEDLFLFALQNMDEPNYISSKPAVHLSLAASYLNISFGSSPKVESIPMPTKDNIKKARLQLEALDKLGLFLPSMRQCEKQIILAELKRLDGKLPDALKLFEEAKNDSDAVKLVNLVSTAEHRCQLIKKEQEKNSFLEELLMTTANDQ